MAQPEVATRPLPRPPVWRQPALLRGLFGKPAPVLDELAATYGPDCLFGAGPMRSPGCATTVEHSAR